MANALRKIRSTRRFEVVKQSRGDNAFRVNNNEFFGFGGNGSTLNAALLIVNAQLIAVSINAGASVSCFVFQATPGLNNATVSTADNSVANVVILQAYPSFTNTTAKGSAVGNLLSVSNSFILSNAVASGSVAIVSNTLQASPIFSNPTANGSAVGNLLSGSSSCILNNAVASGSVAIVLNTLQVVASFTNATAKGSAVGNLVGVSNSCVLKNSVVSGSAEILYTIVQSFAVFNFAVAKGSAGVDVNPFAVNLFIGNATGLVSTAATTALLNESIEFETVVVVGSAKAILSQLESPVIVYDFKIATDASVDIYKLEAVVSNVFSTAKGSSTAKSLSLRSVASLNQVIAYIASGDIEVPVSILTAMPFLNTVKAKFFDISKNEIFYRKSLITNKFESKATITNQFDGTSKITNQFEDNSKITNQFSKESTITNSFTLKSTIK